MADALRNTAKVGRLAFRVEGELWNAYWAPSQSSMDGAVHLGSLRMSVARIPDIKQEFFELMRHAFSAAAKDLIGSEPIWDDPKPAPDHERSGSA